MLTQKI